MLIDDMLFEQEWYSELPLRLRFLYIYLLTKCSKAGVFEVNLRKATYDMNDGNPVTREDIFNSFSGRIKPLGDTKGIFPDYIAWNWMRNKPLDPAKNPLHRGLQQELARYGLTFAKINEMSSHRKIEWIGDSSSTIRETERVLDEVQLEPSNIKAEYEEWFAKFWSQYPSECPRKVDKKKCHDKFILLMKKAKDAGKLFESLIDGLGRWKQSSMWKDDGGKYIKAPLVWLNGACWNDEPMKGNGNAVNNRGCTSANSNYQSADARGIF